MEFYELHPKDGRKSFYGKAKVHISARCVMTLYSYGTPVLRRDSKGRYFRLWDDWSATTGRHIRSFAGLNKKQYMALPYRSR